jgi:hypothetical protein
MENGWQTMENRHQVMGKRPTLYLWLWWAKTLTRQAILTKIRYHDTSTEYWRPSTSW